MKFKKLCEYFERLDETTKRLEMFDILSELFKEASGEDIDKIIYLSQGQLLPPFHGLEIGISDKLLIRAISDATDTPTKKVEQTFRHTGDMGRTAEELNQRKGYDLTIKQVYDELIETAHSSGHGSVEKKIGLLSNLFKGASSIEAKYIARFVIGRLRLGIGDPTVLEALALSIGNRELRPELERAYNLCSDLGLVAKTVLKKGMEGVKKFKIQVGYPIRPALCERLPSSEDIIQKIGKAAIEAKYDGFRVQCHKDGENIELFSRNLERTTHMFPEIAAAIKNFISAKKLIIEGEALAYNEETGELFPFQVTIQRKRKHGIEELSKELPLKFFAFDLLYLDGADYTEKAFSERRKKLESIIKKNDIIEPSELFITDNPDKIIKYFESAIERGLEGVVAKRLDAPYSAGARNFNWIKLKRSYKGELADTIDVCIVGYFRGKGARARFGLGALLGTVYDSKTDTFKTVSKIGSGFKEDEFLELKKLLDEIALKHKHARVDSVMEADVWVEPRYVITVMADEITRSPTHTAGRDKEGVGYALRFPRSTGFIRFDKKAEDANSVKEIIEMFNQQKQVNVS
ncbi:MAG TPA: DNA ligase [Nitrospiraceae bacterium]|nr:MAG: DNA ligase [Nitrospirae bacterium GWA2_46_11]OGW25484.1 MAG: DNA ligase [Nitrospirae bacterium GWB2_47_37]HAK87593.1 DNA ligase [Nitrospiraceae bacterium]HCZ12413.1 DNA ligase [Nitrospiraceae bacterium]